MASGAAKKWEEVQKKAFTHWVNSQLAKRDESIENLQEGFQSGVQLVTLVEVLSGKKIEHKWTKKPNLKVHKINNCFIALNFLQNDLQLKNITVSAEDLVSGEHLNLILGFCWLLLRNFQEPPSDTGDGKQGSGFEASLLQWVKDLVSSYPDIDLTEGFKSECFTNGKTLLALIHEYSNEAVAYDQFKPHNKLENCEAAVQLAQQHMNIPDIINPEELAAGKCEEKEMVLYLSLLYNAFKDKSAGETKESLLKRLQELEEKFRLLSAENEVLKASHHLLEVSTHDLNKKLLVVSEEKSEALETREEVETKLGELKEILSSESQELQEKIEELNAEIELLKASSSDSVTNLQNEKASAAKERDEVREELRRTKDQLTKEKEELQAEHDELTANLNRTRKLREELEDILNNQKENHNKTIHALRKHLLQHIQDISTWRVYLEADREYKEPEVHFRKEAVIEKLEFTKQIYELDQVVLEENKHQDALLRERGHEAAEVVSVTIGKKKKRIKRDQFGLIQKEEDESDDEPEVEQEKKKEETVTSKKGTKKEVQTDKKPKKKSKQ